MLLARSGNAYDRKRWNKLYGHANRQPVLFDRCLAVPARDLPFALEVILKPRSWVAVLIHAPDLASSYPFPFGYVTADPKIVDSYKRSIAELAAKADGTEAVLWTKPDEDAHRALSSIDAALDINVADPD